MIYLNAIHSLSGTLSTQNFLLRRLMTTIVSLGCILGLSIAVYSARSNQRPGATGEEIVLPQETAWISEGLQMQGLDIPHFRINVEAFNAKRKSEIANDSRKLLSLAIALRSELNSSDRPSRDAVRKVNEIERLAHAVKNRMTVSPGPVF